MSALSPEKIAAHLTRTFGLNFSGFFEEFDGGNYIVIRPDDLPRPNGFGIAIARTPKLIEASFHPDSFSGGIIRQMGESENAGYNSFNVLCDSAKKSGGRISLLINGNAREMLGDEDRQEPWKKFEFDCDFRLPTGCKNNFKLIEQLANEVASLSMSLVLSLLEVEEVTDSIPGFEAGLPEGAKIKVEVNKYERNPVNRVACISHYGPVCQVCGFDFLKFYGDIGSGYIEVHHLIPVSEMGGSYMINPIRDLIPLCSNCHSMVHRRNPPFTPEELRKIIFLDS